MKKLVIGFGILLVIAMVLPAAAVPALAKTTGGGFVICPDGQKCGTSWTARFDENGLVKGQAQAQHRSGADTLHAQIDQLGIPDYGAAIVSGIVTNAPDDPDWLDARICFVVVDGGKGGDDYVTAWYLGDIWWCYDNAGALDFHLIEGGNAIVTFTPP